MIDLIITLSMFVFEEIRFLFVRFSWTFIDDELSKFSSLWFCEWYLWWWIKWLAVAADIAYTLPAALWERCICGHAVGAAHFEGHRLLAAFRVRWQLNSVHKSFCFIIDLLMNQCIAICVLAHIDAAGVFVFQHSTHFQFDNFVIWLGIWFRLGLASVG